MRLRHSSMKMCPSSVLSVSLCLLLCFPPCLSSDVTVEPGEDATLQCHSPRDAEIKLVKWIKPDLESKFHVFFYRENRPYENYLHPSYRGRVELKDPEMKYGDVSVVLKNVNTNDAGRYECYVGGSGSEPKFITSFNLTVTDSGDTDERGDKEGGVKKRGDKNLHIGLGVGLTALFVVVAVVVALIFYRSRR